MPKIKLHTAIVFTDRSASYGDIIDVSPADAERLVASEQAEYVTDEIHTAVESMAKVQKAIKKGK